jgi:inorganic pyrophosphatase
MRTTQTAFLSALLGVSVVLAAQELRVPQTLPPIATTQLSRSLEASRAHAQHVWRDILPLNDDGTVSAYVEIPRGERRKFEFDMAANVRAIDRTMPEELGGYPVNYGFVPQTISYDGDPFDALVLGPPLPGGELVRGVIVGLMLMEDEKGHDPKVVLSLPGSDGRPQHALTIDVRQPIESYFKRYRMHEPGKHSDVPGWSSSADGLSYVKTTHAFYRVCQADAGRPCVLDAR